MIREMEKSDWARVSEIYIQSLEKGIATFETICPKYEDWDKKHFSNCRYVAIEESNIVGWITVSPTSNRPAYRGSVEVSIYVDDEYHGKRIGHELMQHLIKIAPKNEFGAYMPQFFQ